MRRKVERKILAISSAGGHWVQLQRLRPAWDGCNVKYVTSKSEYRDIVLKDAVSRNQPVPSFQQIVAANRWQKVKLLWQLISILWIVIHFRPDVVISTGAASGYFALRLGKLFGARTIWIDSIANADELSMSGEKVRPYADLWLTQWEQLIDAKEPYSKLQYRGAVI